MASARPLGNVYTGTCGWADPSLLESGTFYPADVRTPADRLRYYADHFPLVEVDSTYYAPPSERNARLWAERTPAGFVFDVKAYGLLTRHPVPVRSLPAPIRAEISTGAAEKEHVYWSAVPPRGRDLVWTMHIEALRPLAEAGKLGCVLFQFPPWFRARATNRDVLREVAERLPYRIAVEFRGGGWMDEGQRGETLALLEKLGLGYVVVDEPQGFRSSTPPVVACTSPLAVLRFHGRNAATWEARTTTAADRFRYLYAEDELRGWVPPIRHLATQAEQVHALLNNCYRDHAVRNARQLAALIAASGSGARSPGAERS